MTTQVYKAVLSQEILHAFEFSASAHDGQKRRGGLEVPYISHPTAVAFILGRLGFADRVVMAGVLHDVVEDTTVTLQEIEQVFGAEVASIVQGVSEDRSLGFYERKERYVAQVKFGTSEIKAVSAADKIANLVNIVTAYHEGEDVFRTIWTAGPGYTMDLYTRILEAIKHDFQHPIVHELEIVHNQFLDIARKHL